MRREAARNRMVPVGGVGVAITTEQERNEAAFHEGTLALHTGAAPRGTRPPVDLQKRKIWGRRAGVGPLQASKSGLGGSAGGNVDRVSGGCFVRVARARLPHADVTRFFGV
jgi:hypothetical protein